MWRIDEDTITAAADTKAMRNLLDPNVKIKGAPDMAAREAEHDTVLTLLRDHLGQSHPNDNAARSALFARVEVSAPVVKAVIGAIAVPDPDAPVITNRRGEHEPDPDLRDQENIPLPHGYLWLPGQDRQEALETQAEQNLIDEIHPYLPDAWIDHTKTKIGYEIPFTRHFYTYTPPRPVTEIDAELQAIEKEIQQLLGGLTNTLDEGEGAEDVP